MDLSKTKFNFKSTRQLTIVGLTLVATLVTIYVAYASLSRQNVSLNRPGSRPGAANPSCMLALTLNRPTPSPSPTPTPPSDVCTNWGVNEMSDKYATDIITINPALTSATFITNQSRATTGLNNVEAMDSDPVTNILYAVADRSDGTRGLYAVNTNTADSIPDGKFTLVSNISPAKSDISDFSFRRSDNTLWAWVKSSTNGGLYTVNIASGVLTKVFASSLDNVEGIAWDNDSKYLYVSRTPASSPTYSTWELHKYDPSNNTLTYYAALPGDTDTLDFAPPNYMGGLLMGAYTYGSGTKIYTYDVVNKAVVKTYPVVTSYVNTDSFAAYVCQTNGYPPTPAPTPTNACNVSFDYNGDQAICWQNPIYGQPVTYTVHALPTTGGPYYMQTDWYVAAPYVGPHHYRDTQLITAGNTYTVYPDWPGIVNNVTTETHVGLNVVHNVNGQMQILNPACSGGVDFYWTPYVTCPGGIPAPSGTATLLNVSADAYVDSAYPTVNYGSSTTSSVNGSGPVQKAYVKLDLTSLANKSITSARFYVKVSDATSGTQTIKSTSPNWTESTINYNNKPADVSTVGTSGASTLVGSWKEIDLTSFVNANKGSVVSISISTTSTNKLKFYTKESTASDRPLLVIE